MMAKWLVRKTSHLKVARSDPGSHSEILTVLWQGSKTFCLTIAYDESPPDSYRHAPRTILRPPEITIRLCSFLKNHTVQWQDNAGLS